MWTKPEIRLLPYICLHKHLVLDIKPPAFEAVIHWCAWVSSQPSYSDNIAALDVLNELRVEEAEAGKVVLVEVHHEQLVCGRQVHRLRRELTIKVRHVLPMTLK